MITLTNGSDVLSGQYLISTRGVDARVAQRRFLHDFNDDSYRARRITGQGIINQIFIKIGIERARRQK
jgi:hypothetical protein